MNYTNSTNDYVNLGLSSGTWWHSLNPPCGHADKEVILAHQSHSPFSGLPIFAAVPLTKVLQQYGLQFLGMPTDQQMKELLSECTWMWAGNNCYRVISHRNNNGIILPAAGWYIDAAHQLRARVQSYYDFGFISWKEANMRFVDNEMLLHGGLRPVPSSCYLTRKTSQPLAALGLKRGSQVIRFDVESRIIATLTGDIWMPIRLVICRWRKVILLSPCELMMRLL